MTRELVAGPDLLIDAGANPITNVEDPTNDQDAATKKYVDDNAGGATFGTPAIVLGTAAGNGTVDEAIRRDSTIVAFDATVPSTQAFGDSAATGSAAVAARRDHKHAMPATPTSVSGNAGTATALQTGRTIDGQTFDGTADITVIAPGTHAASSKTTPVDADELPLVDSAASNVLKKLTWANLKATIKAYTDTLYSAIGAYAPGGTDVAVADGGTGASTASSARSNLGIPAAVGGVEWTEVTKGGDTSRSSTGTPAADPDLVFTAASGGMYEVELFIVFGSPAGAGTPDLLVKLGEDNVKRGVFTTLSHSSSDNAQQALIFSDQTSTIVAGTAAADRTALIIGSHAGNGGTFAFLWSQNVSGTNATIVRAGSTLRYRRIV